ncbi:hypothetical protein TNCV_2942141 [Trichonephila clavipes]|nr:hypothetical protein TNCV_2942141 [Trichonephila clavipes]
MHIISTVAQNPPAVESEFEPSVHLNITGLEPHQYKYKGRPNESDSAAMTPFEEKDDHALQYNIVRSLQMHLCGSTLKGIVTVMDASKWRQSVVGQFLTAEIVNATKNLSCRMQHVYKLYRVFQMSRTSNH